MDIGFWLILISYQLIVFSSPMPTTVGVIEMLMGVGLVIGSLLLYSLFVFRDDKTSKLLVGCIGYFALAPLLVGFLRGNYLSDIVRDFVPLLFLVVVPLLMVPLLQEKKVTYRFHALMVVIFLVGLVSALQFHHGMIQLYGSMSLYLAQSSHVLNAIPNPGNNSSSTLLPLSTFLPTVNFPSLVVKCQDPAILFSAIYLMCIGFAFVLGKSGRLFPGLLALGGGGFCAYEFALLGMRASSALTLIALMIYVIHLVSLKNVSKWHLIVAGVASLILVDIYLADVLIHLWLKNQAVGGNGKLAELSRVFSAVFESHYTLLFGVGWGGVLHNPIYDGGATRFTHSLISFWLLKTGMVGFSIMVLFVAVLLRRISLKGMWVSSKRLAIFLAATAVIIIGLFFEPTYKMLSFGFIVSLLLAEFSSSLVSQERMAELKPA